MCDAMETDEHFLWSCLVKGPMRDTLAQWFHAQPSLISFTRIYRPFQAKTKNIGTLETWSLSCNCLWCFEFMEITLEIYFWTYTNPQWKFLLTRNLKTLQLNKFIIILLLWFSLFCNIICLKTLEWIHRKKSKSN